MATLAQIEANRANARKSTGPTSQEGKQRSASNGVRHGLCCRQVVLEGEDAQEFQAVSRQFYDELAPVGIMEQMLVDRIASEYWRLQRVVKLERQWMETAMDNEHELAVEALGDERAAALELRLGDAVKRDFEQHAYERLRRYEARIERSLYRARRELQQMQRERKAGDDDDVEAPPPDRAAAYAPASGASLLIRTSRKSQPDDGRPRREHEAEAREAAQRAAASDGEELDIRKLRDSGGLWDAIKGDRLKILKARMQMLDGGESGREGGSVGSQRLALCRHRENRHRQSEQERQADLERRQMRQEQREQIQREIEEELELRASQENERR